MKAERRITVEEREGFVRTRPIPIPRAVITGSSEGTATTFFTMPYDMMFEIERLVILNGSAAGTVTVHAIPNGDTIGAANAEIVRLSLAADEAFDVTTLLQGLYNGVYTFSAFSTGGGVSIAGFGREVR